MAGQKRTSSTKQTTLKTQDVKRKATASAKPAAKPHAKPAPKPTPKPTPKQKISLPWPVTRESRRKLAMTLALAGLLPGVAVNGHLWWAVFPGQEQFRWASFQLGSLSALEPSHAWRLLFASLALLVLWLWLKNPVPKTSKGRRATKPSKPGKPGKPGKPDKQWHGLLFALPLLLAALHPSERMGAHHTVADSLQQLDITVEDLSARQTQALGLFNWAPPWITDPGWVGAKLRLVGYAQRQNGEGRFDVDEHLAMLNTQIETLESTTLSFADWFDLTALRTHLQDKQKLPELRNEQARLQALIDGHRAQRGTAASFTVDQAGGMLIDYVFSLATHKHWLDSKAEQLRMTPYLLACAFLAGAFLWRIGIFNPWFASAVGFWLLGSTLNSAANWADIPAMGLLAALYPVAATLLACMAIRFLMRIWLDNNDIYARLPAAKTAAFWRRSVLLVTPFILLSFGLVFLSHQLSALVWNQVYCNDQTSASCATRPGVAISNSAFDRDTRRDDVHIALQSAIFLQTNDWNRTGSNWDENASEQISEAMEEARNAFDGVFEPALWDYDTIDPPRDCVWFIGFSVPNCAYNAIILGMNASYQAQLRSLNDWYDEKIDAVENKLLDGVAVAGSLSGTPGEVFKADMETLRMDLMTNARAAADIAFLSLGLVQLINLAILLMICGRALVSIQGRLYGHAKPRDVLTLLPPDHEGVGASARFARSTTGRIEMTAQAAQGVLIKRGHGLENARTSTRLLPSFPGNFILRRLFSRCYWLKEVRPTARSKKVTFSIANNQQFVRVSLDPTSAVMFRWRDFVGCSQTVRLERLISLRMSFAAFGQLMSPVARGPGLLILRSRGVPKITTDRNTDSPAVEPYRLITCTLASKFAIDADTKAGGIYLDEVVIVPASDTKAALDVSEAGHRTSGMFSQLVRLLIP